MKLFGVDARARGGTLNLTVLTHRCKFTTTAILLQIHVILPLLWRKNRRAQVDHSYGVLVAVDVGMVDKVDDNYVKMQGAILS